MAKEQMAWEDDGNLRHKVYRSYEAYTERQGSKLESKYGWCKQLSDGRAETMPAVLSSLGVIQQGMSVLCLGARLGGEVVAFRSLGCFALGIDLNPGRGSRTVLHGDFHDLQFADDSVDIVFTNSPDHALYLSRMLSEAHRILKPDGYFILEAKGGSGETERQATGSDHWDCLEWSTIEALADEVEKTGFQLLSGHDGKHRATPYGFVFRKV